MIKNWLQSFMRTAPTGEEASPAFSLARLGRENPGLARHYLWDSNPMPAQTGALWLHFGCGERVLDGFVNMDFIPHDERVTAWNLLDLWPEQMAGTVEGAFSEDTLEHFFHAEQTYILCNVNRALKTGAVARTLMPSLARLVDFSAGYHPTPDEFLHSTFGVETGGDALNMGMRFSGHRWLHDPHSLAHMAAICGFDMTATDCASSSVAKFNGLNLRDESNSLSFANDLRKTRRISRTIVSPAQVTGAEKIEELAADAALFVATSIRPFVEYQLPHSVASGTVACINLRSSNLSAFAEHNLKTLVIDEINRDRPWYFDETLKSRPCMNLITRSQLKLALGGDRDFSSLVFSPAARSGEYFTLGCAEVFVLE